MNILNIRACFWIALCLTTAGCSREQGLTQQAPRTIQMTRVVRIPLTGETQDPATGRGDDAKLTVLPGGTDELPQGPSGFDVSDNETFFIADPLRNRIALFDKNGSYRSEWQVGFAADSVTLMDGNLIQARESNTGMLHLYNQQGKPVEGQAETGEPMQARLSSPGGGVVNWPATPGRREGSLEIRFEKTGMRLLSIEPIRTDSSGDIFVALESGSGGDVVDLIKIVRRYSSDGKLLAETTDLPLEYYIRPTDEIRVRKGVVYQIATTSSEVRINVWDTN